MDQEVVFIFLEVPVLDKLWYQAQVIINNFSKLFINQQVQAAAPVLNYVLIPFEGNINFVDQQGLNIYLQVKKDIDNKSDKLDKFSFKFQIY